MHLLVNLIQIDLICRTSSTVPGLRHTFNCDLVKNWCSYAASSYAINPLPRMIPRMAMSNNALRTLVSANECANRLSSKDAQT